MIPRIQLGSVPYAFTVPDGSMTTLKIANDAVTAEKLNLPISYDSAHHDGTTIPQGTYVYVGASIIQITTPGKLYAECDLSLFPATQHVDWIGLYVVAKKGSTNVTLGAAAYTEISTSGYTSWSAAGILDLAEAGDWTIQCGLQRGGVPGNDPVVHTYNITAFQIK